LVSGDTHDGVTPRTLLEAVRAEVLHSMRDNFTGLTGHPIAFLDETGRAVVAASSGSEAMLVIERSLEALREHVGARIKGEWRLSADLAITRRKL